MDNLPKQVSKEELKAREYECWSPNCKGYAFLHDWMGWKWCIKHWWRSYRWGGGEVSLKSFWFAIKNTRVF